MSLGAIFSWVVMVAANIIVFIGLGIGVGLIIDKLGLNQLLKTAFWFFDGVCMISLCLYTLFESGIMTA